MGKRFYLGLLVIILLTAGIGILLLFTFSNKPLFLPAVRLLSPVIRTITPKNDDWVGTMLSKYPYRFGSYSGVLPGYTNREVWIIGLKKNTNDPNRIIAVIFNDQFSAAVNTNTPYSFQTDDYLNGAPQKMISPIDLREGDPIAIRATQKNGIITASEVRLLLDYRRF